MARSSFKNVPDHWKFPVGPYHQAPAEHGGEWWLVNPFTGPEPWLFREADAPRREMPAGFLEIFGPRPKFSQFLNVPSANLAFRIAVTAWEQELQYFKRAGFPEWATLAERSEAERLFQEWDMGAPDYYEGRYGWMARFVRSEIKDYDIAAWTALHWTHGSIAHYQIALVDRGMAPRKKHPLVPPHIWGDDQEVEEEVA